MCAVVGKTTGNMYREQLNMIVLGLAFMTLFSSFNTMENIEKPFLATVRTEDPAFTGDGYVALSILYITFALFLWFTPSALTKIGNRMALIIGTAGYCFNTASFYTTNTWVIYLGSALCGMASALLWTGHGSYVILNSGPRTITRNTSIFWVFYKCSLFFGNIFVYFVFEGKTQIEERLRMIVVSVLMAMNVLAIVIASCLGKPAHENIAASENVETPVAALKQAWKIFTTPNIILLSIMFCYVGLSVAFNSGVYSASVGFTHQLGADTSKLVPLVGIFIGIGEILSGGLQILQGENISQYKWGGPTVVFVGVLIQVTAYTLVFLYLPDKSVFSATQDSAYLESNVYVAMGCAVLMGTGDGCFTSQIYSILKEMYPNSSAQTVSLYIFINSAATSLGFFYSTLLGLHAQLIILSVTGTIGFIVFAIVTHRVKEENRRTLVHVIKL